MRQTTTITTKALIQHYGKEPPQMPLCSFFLGHILLGTEPSLRNGLCPQREFVEKAIISFVSGYQLEITFGLKIGTNVHFHFQRGDPSVTDLGNCCSCCHSLCEFIGVWVRQYFEGLFGLASSCSLALIMFLTYLPQGSLNHK